MAYLENGQKRLLLEFVGVVEDLIEAEKLDIDNTADVRSFIHQLREQLQEKSINFDPFAIAFSQLINMLPDNILQLVDADVAESFANFLATFNQMVLVEKTIRESKMRNYKKFSQEQIRLYFEDIYLGAEGLLEDLLQDEVLKNLHILENLIQKDTDEFLIIQDIKELVTKFLEDLGFRADSVNPLVLYSQLKRSVSILLVKYKMNSGELFELIVESFDETKDDKIREKIELIEILDELSDQLKIQQN